MNAEEYWEAADRYVTLAADAAEAFESGRKWMVWAYCSSPATALIGWLANDPAWFLLAALGLVGGVAFHVSNRQLQSIEDLCLQRAELSRKVATELEHAP